MTTMLQRIRGKIMTVLVLLLLTVAVLSVSSCRTPKLGVVNGTLLPCPPRPNCVCSQHSADDNTIAPLAAVEADATWLRLREILASWPRTEIIEETDSYLRAVVVTPLLRFRDDVEFLLDRDAGCIQVRSASRVGYSDLGVNRRRIEQLRTRLSE
ncbi:MAG: DUF1499 domain-containing protein [Planctomycetota bacterium]